ncbi:MAG TPA: hypothetical protein DCZ05_12385 [Deltaproteobacteria bacterium]|nr:hypothetical protein [Deltaproteobacteria bacterium]
MIQRLAGLALLVCTVLVALYGDKPVAKRQGHLLRVITMPRFNMLVLKWAAVFLLGWFGLALLLDLD